MVRHDIEAACLRRGGGRRRRGHLRREQQAGRAGHSARPWRRPRNRDHQGDGVRDRPPSPPPRVAPRACAGAWLPASAARPVRCLSGRSGQRAGGSWVSSRCRSSSVSMLFPSSSCCRLVPRWPGQPEPRATGPAHGGYGTSPCPLCIRAPPLSPAPTGLPRTAARARPAAAPAAGGRHAAAIAVEHRSGGIAHRRQRRQVRGERFRMPALRVRHRSLTRLGRQSCCMPPGIAAPRTSGQPSATEPAEPDPPHRAGCRPAGKRNRAAARRPAPRTPRTQLHPRQPASGSLFAASHCIKRHPSRPGCQRTAQGRRRVPVSAGWVSSGCGRRSPITPLDLAGKQPASRRSAAGARDWRSLSHTPDCMICVRQLHQESQRRPRRAGD